MFSFSVGDLTLKENQLFLIAGPDVLESQDLALEIAEAISIICERLSIKYIFKSSYRKDNRTSIHGYSGPGIEKGLKILEIVRDRIKVPVTSDVHGIPDLHSAKGVLDMIQIPAFLCKQTSLLVAAGETNLPINVKKGQFLDPYSMKFVIEKIESTGNKRILLTERGTSFGYNHLINDFRAIPIMQSFGYPVIYDVGHSVRMLGIPSESPEGGHPEFIPHLMRAGLGAGSDGIFIEVHPNPTQALCDASSQYPLKELESLLIQAKTMYLAVRPYVSRLTNPKPLFPQEGVDPFTTEETGG